MEGENKITSNVDNSSNGVQEKAYCICRSSVADVFMIMCDNCKEWYHGECINVTYEHSKIIHRYYCSQCSTKEPFLKTTYKKNHKRKYKLEREKRSKDHKFPEPMDLQASHDVPANSEIGDSGSSFQRNNLNTTVSNNTPCFSFEDTTIRRAKSEAYEKFKSATVSSQRCKENKKKSTTEVIQLKQCYGPDCTKASRNGSKYCSDTCGIALGRNRIIEILPARINQWISTPSAADEECKKNLTKIRSQLQDITTQLEATDIKIIHLIDKINKAKRPGNVFAEVISQDTTQIDCVLCGAEVQSRSIEKHFEQCYRRLERKIFITGCTLMPQDVQWNMFCNYRISKHVYCKKLRVLCPLHYKDFRKDTEVCGYLLAENDGVGTYCGNVGKTCSHVNWEEIQRAELDLEKLNLILKFNNLKKEETRIRKEMASRGDFLSLMLHETITH